MFTIGMSYDSGMAEDKTLQQNGERDEEEYTTHQYHHSNMPYDPWMQDGGMVQRVANGYIAIQSHGHKYT
jgi:hypothetical protein